MTCSAARLEANRRDAQKSTGPRTAAGKEASRLNAFRHGMAGAGNLVGPGEDAAAVGRRAAAIAREFGAAGEMGEILANRAAVLSIRMERATVREFAQVGADMAAAREEFDAGRREMIAGWVADLDGAADPRPALDALGEAPEGQVHLAEAWLDLHARVRAGDAAAEARARAWLDRPGPAAPGGKPLPDRILAEADRLLGRVDASTAAVAAERARAGLLASFDPSPEAARARRYEAAAERGMFQALRMLQQLRRDRAADGEADRAPAEPPGPVAPSPRPSSPPPPPALTPGGAVGSFRDEGPTTAPGLASTRADRPTPLAEPDPTREERRKNRPDLRKLAKKRR